MADYGNQAGMFNAFLQAPLAYMGAKKARAEEDFIKTLKKSEAAQEKARTEAILAKQQHDLETQDWEYGRNAITSILNMVNAEQFDAANQAAAGVNAFAQSNPQYFSPSDAATVGGWGSGNPFAQPKDPAADRASFNDRMNYFGTLTPNTQQNIFAAGLNPESPNFFSQLIPLTKTHEGEVPTGQYGPGNPVAGINLKTNKSVDAVDRRYKAILDATNRIAENAAIYEANPDMLKSQVKLINQGLTGAGFEPITEDDVLTQLPAETRAKINKSLAETDKIRADIQNDALELKGRLDKWDNDYQIANGRLDVARTNAATAGRRADIAAFSANERAEYNRARLKQIDEAAAVKVAAEKQKGVQFLKSQLDKAVKAKAKAAVMVEDGYESGKDVFDYYKAQITEYQNAIKAASKNPKPSATGGGDTRRSTIEAAVREIRKALPNAGVNDIKRFLSKKYGGNPNDYNGVISRVR